MVAKGYEVSVLDDRSVLKLDHGDDCTTLVIDQNPLNCAF